MAMARRATSNPGLVHIPRVMRDVDTMEDLSYVVRDGSKPDFTRRISRLLGPGVIPDGPL